MIFFHLGPTHTRHFSTTAPYSSYLPARPSVGGNSRAHSALKNGRPTESARDTRHSPQRLEKRATESPRASGPAKSAGAARPVSTSRPDRLSKESIVLHCSRFGGSLFDFTLYIVPHYGLTPTIIARARDGWGGKNQGPDDRHARLRIPTSPLLYRTGIQINLLTVNIWPISSYEPVLNGSRVGTTHSQRPDTASWQGAHAF